MASTPALAVRTIPTHVGRTASRGHESGRSGPSPRTWGEHGEDRHGIGQTDHPHARGENTAQPHRTRASLGPSPRTWGERSSDKCRRRLQSGPSPRTWGERGPATVDLAQRPDHPHARGENVARHDLASPLLGPSPRTWGEPESAPSSASAYGPSPRTWGELDGRVDHSRPSSRTIPTHVGRTLDFPGFNSRFQAKRRVFRMGQPVQHPPISRRPSTGHSPRCPCGRLGQLCRFCSPGNLGNC